MEAFRVHIIGCGSALPTQKHNATSQVVEIRNKHFMIDCGEGTQVQLRRSHIAFTKIQSVFISHLHGDHCFGLIGMISTFGLLGRTSPLHIYAPTELEPMLDHQLELFCNGLEYKVVFHAIDPSQSAVIYDDKSLTVTTIPLDHRIPCCGFLFREKPLLPHIRRDMIDFYQIPLCYINVIKNGAGWTTADGKDIPHEQLVTPADPVRSYAYCSDTKYMPTLKKAVSQVNLLYHESTYAACDEERAAKYYHSTSVEAATVARDAGVGQLLLGHYSARYNNEATILEEAQRVFPNSHLSQEGMCVEVV